MYIIYLYIITKTNIQYSVMITIEEEAALLAASLVLIDSEVSKGTKKKRKREWSMLVKQWRQQQTVFQWIDDVMLTVLEFLFISHELSVLTFRSNIKILTSTQNFFIASNSLKNCYQLSAINSSTLVHVAIYCKQLVGANKLLRVRSP